MAYSPAEAGDARNYLELRIRLEESGQAVGQANMQLDEDRPKT